MAGIIIVATLINLAYFGHMYIEHGIKLEDRLKVRDVGVEKIADRINREKGNYKKILVTNYPDEPYVWVALQGNYAVEKFNEVASKRDKSENGWNYENIYFMKMKCPSEIVLKMEAKDLDQKMMVIDGEGCATDGIEVKGFKFETIKRADGKPIFNVWTK